MSGTSFRNRKDGFLLEAALRNCGLSFGGVARPKATFGLSARPPATPLPMCGLGLGNGGRRGWKVAAGAGGGNLEASGCEETGWEWVGVATAKT